MSDVSRCVKTELWKALHEPMLWAALGIGTLIAGVNVAETVFEVRQLTAMTASYIERTGQYASFAGCSLFIHWLATNISSYGSRVFFLVWPILAAMPFGWSYCGERKSGLYDQIVSRAGVREYYKAKYIAVFVSGGLAVGLPVLLNLLANALICPADVPGVQLSLVAIFDGCFLSALFYAHPWAHSLIWCLVDFLFGGAAACLCFVVGTRLRHQVMVMLTPFALLLVLDGAFAVLQSRTGSNVELSALRLAAATGGLTNPEWAVFTAIGVMLALSFGMGWRQVVCHELA